METQSLTLPRKSPESNFLNLITVFEKFLGFHLILPSLRRSHFIFHALVVPGSSEEKFCPWLLKPSDACDVRTLPQWYGSLVFSAGYQNWVFLTKILCFSFFELRPPASPRIWISGIMLPMVLLVLKVEYALWGNQNENCLHMWEALGTHFTELGLLRRKKFKRLSTSD